MATNPQGAVLSTALTEYAFSIVPDFNAIMAEADFVAPRVVTGAKKGDFSIFDTKQAFLNYAAARAIGCTYQAVDKWPDDLPPRIADRVQAALWRQQQAQTVQAVPTAQPAHS